MPIYPCMTQRNITVNSTFTDLRYTSYAKRQKSWRKNPEYNTLASFKLQYSLGFATSCYVIMNISIAGTIDKLKIRST